MGCPLFYKIEAIYGIFKRNGNVAGIVVLMQEGNNVL
jgi:hypothetical protein